MTNSINTKLLPLWQFFKENAAIGFSLLSGYGYLCAYLYYTGFADFYGIPVNMIPIELSDIIRFALSLLIVLVLFSITVVLFPSRRKLAFVQWMAFTAGTLILFDYLRQLMALPNEWVYVIMSIIAVAGLIALSLPKESSADLQPTSNFPSKRAIVISFVIFVYASTSLCSKLGYGKAANTVIYLISDEKPNLIVIDHHNDNFLCVTYDPKTKKIGDTISVFKLKDSGTSHFIATKTGRLKSNSLSDKQ